MNSLEDGQIVVIIGEMSNVRYIFILPEQIKEINFRSPLPFSSFVESIK